MVRVHLVAFASLSITLAGCGGGSEKELPKDVTIPSDRGKEDPTIAVPSASQPEAVKFVQKCLAAATEGHPERLEKLKVNRLTEQGPQLIGMNYVPTTRTVAAVWPDRFWFADESNVDGPLKISIGMNRQSLTFLRNGESKPPLKGFDDVLRVDSIALHWMPMLVPLTDPRTIVFDVKKQTVANVAWDTVQVAVPACPTFTLWFEEKTNLLGVLTYVHVEGDVSKLNKKLMMGGHKPLAGVQLPTKTEFERNGINVETWTITSREFPEKIEDSVFDQK